MSLRYGADLVYSEEIVDKRIVSAVRVPNGTIHHDTILYCFYSGGLDSNRSTDCVSTDCVSTDFCVPMDCHDLAAILHSVDFISRTGDSVVFRTCPEETGKVVFQIGTADAVLALKAAETVCVVGEGCNSIEIRV